MATSPSTEARIDPRESRTLPNTIEIARAPRRPHVPESRFGTWFINTGAWNKYVLEIAVGDLEGLIADRRESYQVIVDAGCGWGHSLQLLQNRFRPEHLVAIDIDAKMIAAASAKALRPGLKVEFQTTTGSQLRLADGSIDMIFCHQTFHHFVDQEEALREFYRVLKPKGVLLFAESTRRFIHSWIIRLLFRHPMDVQRTAAEYLSMIRGAGFAVAPESISYPYLWWSRPDFAIFERCFGIAPRAGYENTQINLAAIRP
jgi:ubiquinone/menaquinone biosynthesis C-methylase UbiE